MLTLILCFLYTDLPVLKQESHQYDLPMTSVPPYIQVNHAGEVWVTSYWEGWIKRFDKSHQQVFSLDGENDVPIGTKYIITILEIDKNRTWFGTHGLARVLELDRNSGKHLKTYKMDATGMFQWGEKVLLGVGRHEKAPPGHLVIEVNKEGSYTESWPMDIKTMLAKSTGMNQILTVQDQRLFWTTGMVPELVIFQPGKQQKLWELPTPLKFVPHPEKKFSLSERFDRQKSFAYYNSFTKIASVHAIGTYGIAVCWEKGDQPFLLDIFDYRTGKRLHKTLKVPGKLIAIHANRLYFHENNHHFETGQTMEDEVVALHIWDVDLAEMRSNLGT